MPTMPASPIRSPRALILASAGLSVLLAGTLALWAWYGTAVFAEMVLAGLAACF